MINLLPSNGSAVLYENFLRQVDSDRLFQTLMKNVQWEEKKILMYGKQIPIPRLTAWYGDGDYSYSGIENTRLDWTPPLLWVKQKIEEKTGCEYSNVLLNLYRNGNDSIAWHADDEPELGENPTIASLSLGCERGFRIRRKNGKGEVIKVKLKHGSLLVMSGEMQKHWIHELPKDSTTEPRINLTFRKIWK